VLNISKSTHLQINTLSNQHIIKSTHYQINTSAHQQITVLPHQLQPLSDFTFCRNGKSKTTFPLKGRKERFSISTLRQKAQCGASISISQTLAHHRITVLTHQPINKSLHHLINTSAHLQISTSAHQQITVLPHQLQPLSDFTFCRNGKSKTTFPLKGRKERFSISTLRQKAQCGASSSISISINGISPCSTSAHHQINTLSNQQIIKSVHRQITVLKLKIYKSLLVSGIPHDSKNQAGIKKPAQATYPTEPKAFKGKFIFAALPFNQQKEDYKSRSY